MTYGCESWELKVSSKSKVLVMEMKYLRAVIGITRRDKIANKMVRDTLNVEPIIKHIESQQVKWFGHLTRMGNERQVKRVWQARPQKIKTRGRPRKTWNDAVQ
ncbi:hypothetical protein RI129_000497 [Pyrocoelia pectoralis]|uniref:Reverse transcriptase n=1 Tax=Pyrocoelia pectoralis TaxID=417401 RepID=A0AAN7VUE4_9COLE